MRALALLLILAWGAAPAAELTESDAVERGLARAEVVDLLRARREVAAGEVQASGLWPNPEVEYSRESLDLPGGTGREEFLWIRQRLNLAGVHGLERDAAVRRQAAGEARLAWAEREMAARIRGLFHTALAIEQEAARVAAWHARLVELESALDRRVAAGDASRYDLWRVRNELALVEGERLQARAEAEAARDRLFSLIGGAPAGLRGEVLPPPVSAVDTDRLLADHPLLRALAAEAEGAALDARAADRSRWPEVTVGAGRKELNEPGPDADGNLLSLAVEIPLFDRGRGRARANRARADELEADRMLAVSRLGAEARATLGALESRRRAALALRELDAGRAESGESLATIAEHAYAGGEIGILELIDAHRTELATRREAIRRALAARQAFIELQMLTGMEP